MSSNLIFTPVQASEEKIQATEHQAGWLYFATDTGRIYLDTTRDGERINMGGAGAALYYGNTKAVENEETLLYHLDINGLEDKSGNPKVGDLILNQEDGAFYRIIEITSTEFICKQLAVSGTGGGGGGGGSVSIIRPEIDVKNTLGTTSLINGQDFTLDVTVTSFLTAAGSPYDELFTVFWELTDTSTNIVYKKGTFDAEHLVTKQLPLGPYLRDSTTTKIQIWADGGNHEQISRKAGPSVTTSELYLALPSSYSSLNVYDDPANVTFTCNVYGDMTRVAIFYFDGKEVDRFALKEDDSVECTTKKIPTELTTHGSHTVRIELWQQYPNGKLGLFADAIQFEIAIKDGVSEKPIIWLGEYADSYYNYDAIIIPYAIYNPGASATDIVLKKDNIAIRTLEGIVNTTNKFYSWEITDATVDQMNYYQICCGDENSPNYVSREIGFKVTTDPDRKVVPITGYSLYFDPRGRSNDETAVERKIWTQDIVKGSTTETIVAEFEDFNWKNNGWLMDEDLNTTYLRVSNGAKFTLPIGKMVFAGTSQSEQSHTIEMQLKISNNQLYSNLVSNVTRYDIPLYATEVDEENGIAIGDLSYNAKGEVIYKGNDTVEYNSFLKSSYENYDKYLLDAFSGKADIIIGESVDDETGEIVYNKIKVNNNLIYDLLTFTVVQKNIDISKAACQYLTTESNTTVGLAIGTQDAFFTNGQETVNVSFVENDLINLTFLYNNSLKLLQIYINGVISGVIKSTRGFTINSDLVFDSTNCDIDIYSIRIYDKELNINNIVHNFAVDRKDIPLFDQVNKYQMAKENESLNEYQLSYKSIEDYNEKNPNNPTMPYIIFDTTANPEYTDNKLPWSKKITRNIGIEFVNAPLDAAYENGELEELAIKDGLMASGETDSEIIKTAVKNYYKHHCPSWTSSMSDDDLVEIVVQGTSSEFYPRRNFKVKTKIKDVPVWDDEEKNEDGTVGAYVEDDVLNIFMNRGPFAEVFAEEKTAVEEDDKNYGHEECRLNDGWYMNNYTNGTDRWTFKVDYMESSGSYNAGFASMVGSTYSKHPLQDYLDILESTDDKKTVADLLGPQVDINKSLLTKGVKWSDYRTSLLGFPVMAFQKRWDASGKEEYLFIGYYRMLLDKGSDEVLGFKTDKKINHSILDKKLRDVAECWEFSTNNRGYCSYRDPYSRVKLSFKAPESRGIKGFVDGTFAPVVTNDFEYRYHAEEDGLDAILNYKNLTSEDIAALNKTYGTSIPVADQSGVDLTGPKAAQDLYVDVFSKNWEEVCQWIYSTNLDDVIAEQTYEEVEVGEALYETGVYYVYAGLDEEQNNIYEISNDAFDSEATYYVKDETKISVTDEEGNTTEEFLYPDGYKPIKLVNDSNYVYVANKFYQKNNNVYSIITNDTFDSSMIYYESKTVENFEDKADLLVRKASEVGTFDSNETYYTYNDQALVSKGSKTNAVQLVTDVKEADFDKYYVAYPVTYLNREYAYDTQEYRAAKFVNELKDHFDPEYLATYFIMTEVFECYDSRGKNCMMATWGPQKEGGNYIWYPIFYDIDTQLGINNTGIPSFEYNVDATEEGNYSTNDSLLWNNFYSFFKNSYILDKYKQLRNSGTIDRSKEKWYDVKNPPLTSIDNIEKWYLFDPTTHNNIACRGVRPLIATNLDEYFKYITITNENAVSQGVGYLEGNEGVETIDTVGTFFYALQGDRSQSREQFLTNRIEYTDSWLGQMNYSRGGGNRIRGRISANNMAGDITSDHWVETDSESYWVDEEYGTKRHEFDAEYWLKLTPVRSAYVTAGDDSENYQPEKYDGTEPVKYKLTALESGIKTSQNYNEQLLYIYGLKTMRDVGDMSKLYWTEFNIEGEAPKLIRLQLGYDGISSTDPTVENGKWYNKKINAINLKAAMPLLKEANFSNLTILSNNLTIDLTTSPKLENFRAVGSNIQTVYFAEGAALNTVYVPKSLVTLSLDNTNLLKNLITTNTAPIPSKAEDGSLIAQKGLYIDGLFGSTEELKLSYIKMKSVPLGYQSYTFLKQLYNRTTGTGFHLTMTDVDWCPYTKLMKGDIYDSSATYYIDNGHYQFKRYNINEDSTAGFNAKVLNGEIYRDDRRTDIVTVDDSFLSMLKEFISSTNSSNYQNYDANSHPELTGIVYVENNTAVDESYIANTLQKKFPGLTFFFKNVTKAYSGKFVIYDEEALTYTYVPFIDGSTSIPSLQKITQSEFEAGAVRFDEPFSLYSPKKDHYDFIGWSTTPTGTILTNATEWNESSDTLITNAILSDGSINDDNYDYIYYARFEKHKYNIRFHNLLDNTYGEYTDDYGNYNLNTVTYGEALTANVPMPWADDSSLDPEERNSFRGWTFDKDSGIIHSSTVNLSNILVDVTKYPAIKDYDLYAVFQSESVYDTPTSYEYFIFTDNSDGTKTIHLNPENGNNLTGKVTLPAKDPDGNEISTIGFILNDGQATASSIGINITYVFCEKDSNYVRTVAGNNSRGSFADATNGYTDYKIIGVYLPDTLKVIGTHAFRYNLKIKTVKFNCVEEIHEGAFYLSLTSGRGNLEMDSLPDTVRSLGKAAFQGCGNLTLTKLPSKITIIPESCFSYCPKLAIAEFGSKNSDDPNNSMTIEYRAFNTSGASANMQMVNFYCSNLQLAEQSFRKYGGSVSGTGNEHASPLSCFYSNGALDEDMFKEAGFLSVSNSEIAG